MIAVIIARVNSKFIQWKKRNSIRNCIFCCSILFLDGARSQSCRRYSPGSVRIFQLELLFSKPFSFPLNRSIAGAEFNKWFLHCFIVYNFAIFAASNCINLFDSTCHIHHGNRRLLFCCSPFVCVRRCFCVCVPVAAEDRRKEIRKQNTAFILVWLIKSTEYQNNLLCCFSLSLAPRRKKTAEQEKSKRVKDTPIKNSPQLFKFEIRKFPVDLAQSVLLLFFEFSFARLLYLNVWAGCVGNMVLIMFGGVRICVMFLYLCAIAFFPSFFPRSAVWYDLWAEGLKLNDTTLRFVCEVIWWESGRAQRARKLNTLFLCVRL